ncbi:hypothetical protein FNV43_RR09658 [Rhamnella rubrinervis]|uniref:Uncharacterized protein n=1 Tax=Rhamnella rubrinervis TaxID=2594499 RepID=A0A8K0MKK3_9ROSA|nr:hypothetical protein FNV43_RR09658 [Rhamnella rubrinervis]
MMVLVEDMVAEPWSYGSKGSGASDEYPFGGNGGGDVKLLVKDLLYVNGSVTAEGGDRGSTNGGGSGREVWWKGQIGSGLNQKSKHDLAMTVEDFLEN